MVRPPVPIYLGDLLQLRRRHPCGGQIWQVDRVGADIGLRCLTCRRHVLLERRRLERRLVAILQQGDRGLTAALGPSREGGRIPDEGWTDGDGSP